MTRLESTQFINREVSWLRFNERVLREAMMEDRPALERVRFLAIFASNLDEFTMVRLHRLLRKQAAGQKVSSKPDGTQIESLIQQVHQTSFRLYRQATATFGQLTTVLREAGIDVIQDFDKLSAFQRRRAFILWNQKIRPSFIRQDVDPSAELRSLDNAATYVVLSGRSADDRSSQLTMRIPDQLQRWWLIPSRSKHAKLMPLEVLLREFLPFEFESFQAPSVGFLRPILGTDYDMDQFRLPTLHREELRDRMEQLTDPEYHKRCVRCYASGDLGRVSIQQITRNAVGADVLFERDILFDLTSLHQLYSLDHPRLKFQAFNPRLPSALGKPDSLFKIIRQEDLLIHHPYESFYTVVEFMQSAAKDPSVKCIQHTSYRSADSSRIHSALMQAARQGKSVTVVLELKARFDEKANMSWADRLKAAGVRIVYGQVELKVHAKATLIQREEGGHLRSYAHLATGNYHDHHARQYTDLGLLTCHEGICGDVEQLFELLTATVDLPRWDRLPKDSRLRQDLPDFRWLAVAPFNLRDTVRDRLRELTSRACRGERCVFWAKMNSLVDPEMIALLYEASRAGVQVRLIVRGVCCLLPQIPGLSENIEVRSVIDRFLEHSRVYAFFAGDEGPEVFISSADLMPRNLDRRIEVLIPIVQSSLRRRIVQECLQMAWQDNCRSYVMGPQGVYEARRPEIDDAAFRSQEELIATVRRSAVKSLPYTEAIRTPMPHPKERPFASQQP